jgi:hypothetical protein
VAIARQHVARQPVTPERNLERHHTQPLVTTARTSSEEEVSLGQWQLRSRNGLHFLAVDPNRETLRVYFDPR